MSNPTIVNLSSTDTKVKYAAAKQAIALSRTDPGKLYADFGFFVKLLDNPNQILK